MPIMEPGETYILSAGGRACVAELEWARVIYLRDLSKDGYLCVGFVTNPMWPERMLKTSFGSLERDRNGRVLRVVLPDYVFISSLGWTRVACKDEVKV